MYPVAKRERWDNQLQVRPSHSGGSGPVVSSLKVERVYNRPGDKVSMLLTDTRWCLMIKHNVFEKCEAKIFMLNLNVSTQNKYLLLEI